MSNLNRELALYKSEMAQKPQVVVVNKVDLPEVQARLPEIGQLFSSLGVKAFFVSAITKHGVSELMSETAKILDEVQEKGTGSEVPMAVFRPKPKVRRGK
jgi:GTP-binding protein